MNYEIVFEGYQITSKHKKKIIAFVNELVGVYSLQNNYFKLSFVDIFYFGSCFPSINFSKSSILINKDLLKENLFEELKGCLAHEFAHFFHYVNFSNVDKMKFIYRIGGHVYSRKFTKSRFVLFGKYNTYYEQITDLTACNFGYQKELISLKKFVPIYRKKLNSDKIPDSSHYLSYEFLKQLKKKDIVSEAEKRKKLLAFKSLKYS